MYERNAIVIDRYFASVFGYDNKSNMKNNSSNYFELVKNLENYQEASENENIIMKEFENIASKIKETQKLQDVLNKRNLKYSESRKNLFDSLDEEPDVLRKKFEKLEEEIDKNNQEIKENAQKFVEEIIEFNEKSETRSICGRERRVVENEYQKILTLTTDNFNSINKSKLKEAKAFVKSDKKNDSKKEIKEKILRNGSKEKVPFDENVIITAIDTSTYIEEKRAEILLSLYDKTNKLLDEIKNDTVKIEKHKKIVTDSKSKLEFLNVISEYIILFLDNERMNTMGGEEEHQKIMNEACKSLQSDLIEIQNMYSLLIKEITGKSSKKAYKELYNIQYLLDLQEEERIFEKSISKINMIGTIIYPDYWRIEGMQKIYDTFKNIVTDVYGKDLSEFEPLDITFAVNEEALNDDEEDDDEVDLVKEKIENIEINNNENSSEKNIDKKENEIKEQSTEKVLDKKEIDSENEKQDEEEFFWDDDDENDELIFTTKKNLENEESSGNNEDEDNVEEELDIFSKEDKDVNDNVDDNNSDEDNDEDATDKEIDEILGFFDKEDEDEAENVKENEEEELLILDHDEDDEDFDDEDEDDEDMDKIFDEEKKEEEKEDKKVKKKRRGLFARRSK